MMIAWLIEKKNGVQQNVKITATKSPPVRAQLYICLRAQAGTSEAD